ncbi:serine O-acetyltransferase [Flavobacterium sp. CAN_S2]|uniref:serine O-acetyltransferase n=1 Tax=Flavobacterium sp. CAN_S2 TaxID=2787726 RepID=UPI0018C9ECB5
MNKEIDNDLYRYVGSESSFFYLFRLVLFTPSFRYFFLYRKTRQASTLVTKLFWKFFLRQCMLRTGIQIPASTVIGRGLRIVHFGHIIINPAVSIGKNFNIYPGVTIGHSEGKRKGSPIIGDNVSIQTNAVVVGGIKIGDNVLIAPNAFVNFDVPDGSIVLGNPGKIIPHEKGSANYIVYYVD